MVLNTLSQDKKDKLRLLAAELMEEWRDVDAVAQILGCRRDFIKRWHRHYQRGGRAALVAKRSVGRPSKLNDLQKALVQEFVFSRSPREFGFDRTLWTNRGVVELIAQLYQINLGLPSANRLLESFGIAAGNPASVKARKALITPSRTAALADGKMMAYFQHAVAVDKTDPYGEAARSDGEDYVRRHSHRRAWVLGTVDKRNSRRFMVSPREPDDRRFVDFLERLIHHCVVPVTLVVAGTWHPPTPVIEAYADRVTDRLRLVLTNGHRPHDRRANGEGR